MVLAIFTTVFKMNFNFMSNFIRENSFLRLLYRRYISKIPGANLAKDQGLKLIRRIKRSFERPLSFKLLSFPDFCHDYQINKTVLLPRTAQVVEDMWLFSADKSNNGKASVDSYFSPECVFVSLRDISVLSRTDFFFHDGYAVHEEFYNPEKYLTTLEQMYIGHVVADDTLLIGLKNREVTVDKGVNLLSSGAGNYTHFICEVITKLLLLNSKEFDRFRDYPLIVDGWSGPNYPEIISFFNQHCHEIIYLDSFEFLNVQNLLHISAPIWSPQEFRFTHTNSYSDFMSNSYLFSSQALGIVRDYARKKINRFALKNVSSKKRIYLQRKPKFIEGIQYNVNRYIVNEGEVVEILKKFDFEIIDITSLSFVEQVKLFYDVEVVVAPLGAVLINVIFSKPGIDVIGLGVSFSGADYSYHTRMMSGLGHNYKVVLGNAYYKGSVQVNLNHVPYAIDIPSLHRALNEVFKM